MQKPKHPTGRHHCEFPIAQHETYESEIEKDNSHDDTEYNARRLSGC